MTDTHSVALTRNEIAIIHKALGEQLHLLLKEWEHQESVGQTDAPPRTCFCWRTRCERL